MIGQPTRCQRKYARIGVDMRRFGHFWPEVPESEEAGFISHARPVRAAYGLSKIA
jgi:hypothetical protein